MFETTVSLKKKLLKNLMLQNSLKYYVGLSILAWADEKPILKYLGNNILKLKFILQEVPNPSCLFNVYNYLNYFMTQKTLNPLCCDFIVFTLGRENIQKTYNIHVSHRWCTYIIACNKESHAIWSSAITLRWYLCFLNKLRNTSQKAGLHIHTFLWKLSCTLFKI